MIHVIDNYYIEIESSDCTLKVDTGIKDKKGQTIWKIIGYFPTVKSCIARTAKEIACSELRDKTVELEEAVSVIRESNRKLEEILHKLIGNV